MADFGAIEYLHRNHKMTLAGRADLDPQRSCYKGMRGICLSMNKSGIRDLQARDDCQNLDTGHIARSKV